MALRRFRTVKGPLDARVAALNRLRGLRVQDSKAGIITLGFPSAGPAFSSAARHPRHHHQGSSAQKIYVVRALPNCIVPRMLDLLSRPTGLQAFCYTSSNSPSPRWNCPLRETKPCPAAARE
jgi:hypothetical protein